MTYHLDTNICIYFMKGQFPPLVERVRNCRLGELAVSAVTVAELHFGVARSKHPERNRGALDRFLKDLEEVPFDGHAARIFGNVKQDLLARGLPIGPYDLQIAAIALSRGATLVTRNLSEFRRVAGLAAVDWTS